MVRTIKFAKVDYLKKGDGTQVHSAVVIANNDEESQRAVNKIVGKRNGAFVLNTEYVQKKYEIDDEIFFTYAKEITD